MRGRVERGRRCRITAGPVLLSGGESQVGSGSPRARPLWQGRGGKDGRGAVLGEGGRRVRFQALIPGVAPPSGNPSA